MGTSRKDIAALVMEFIGSFTLMFLGAGAIIQTAGGDLVAIALAHGLAIGVMVAAGAHISGGLYNPALVVGLMAGGKLPIPRGVAYIVAELLGGIAAAALLKATLPTDMVNAVKLGATLPGPGISAGQALVVEIVITFFLMFVVFGTAVDKLGAGTIAPLMIGITITIGILMGGAISGASMNPSRSIGPMIVQGEWQDFWVYFVGPVVGALLAALVYIGLLLDNQPDPAVAAVEPPQPTPRADAPRPAARSGRSSRR